MKPVHRFLRPRKSTSLKSLVHRNSSRNASKATRMTQVSSDQLHRFSIDSFSFWTENEKESLPSEGTNPMTSSKDSSTSANLDKDKKSNRTQLGAFGNNPSMMKLFELIRSSYQTFKTSLSSTDTDRFSQLLSTTLTCMRSVLNLVSIQDMSKHLEETLNYLKSTFNVEKIKSIQCTQEVGWWFVRGTAIAAHPPLF